MRHLGHLLRDGLLAHRGRVALIETRKRQVRRQLDYAEVLDAVVARVHQLRERGVGAGDRVALLGENSPEWLVAATAALWCGAVLVPLDARLPPEDQDGLLAHARPALLLAHEGLARALCWQGPCVMLDAPVPGVEGVGLPEVTARDGEDPACQVYTSGTGGTPLGCLLSHRAYLAQLDALMAVAPLAPGDRWFSFLPSNHAIDFMCGFLGPLSLGATVVHQRVLRPEYLRWTLETQAITHFAAVPALLAALRRGLEERLDALPSRQRWMFDGLCAMHGQLTRNGPDPRLARLLLGPVQRAFGGKLQRIYCGGAFAEPELLSFFHRLGLPVAVGYGLTEACTVVTLQDLAPPTVEDVGKPLPGLRVSIEAPDAGGVGEYPEQIEADLSEVGTEDLVVFAAGYLWPGRGLGGGAEELVAAVHADDIDAVERRIATAQRGRPERFRVKQLVVVSGPFPRTATRKIKRAALAERIREAGLQPRALRLQAAAERPSGVRPSSSMPAR